MADTLIVKDKVQKFIAGEGLQMSEAVTARLDEEVRKLLKKACERVKELKLKRLEAAYI